MLYFFVGAGLCFLLLQIIAVFVSSTKFGAVLNTLASGWIIWALCKVMGI